MQRGRKPKPAHLKLITGNPGKRPIAKDDVPPLQRFPPAPEYMSDYAKEEWNRIGAELVALRILTTLDTTVLGCYCEAFSAWRTAVEGLRHWNSQVNRPGKALMLQTKNGNWQQIALLGSLNKSSDMAVKFAAELGMTPSARGRMATVLGGAPPVNKFTGLIGGV